MTSRGSEWRKWDLHVHTPVTRLANAYRKVDGEPDWDRFCEAIHNSDVVAFGITDYFSLDSFYEFKERYSELYPGDREKVFFPNLELRLDHGVNKSGAEINIHLILPPSLEKDDADRLLTRIELVNSAQGSDRQYTCKEASKWNSEKLKSAMTTIAAIRKGIKETFDGAEQSNLEQYAMIVVSGRGDGLSPGQTTEHETAEKAAQRKEALIDIIDDGVDAVFARAKDAAYWLSRTRIKSSAGSVPKPTFGGSDAHDFDGLENMLGKTGEFGGRLWETTWIKADVSWEGLLQTLAEPDSRVSISELEPDWKSDYRVIETVEFHDEAVFPQRVELNPNLNAIIGSRSSGKSSLLAHIAFAVDSEETKKQQEAAGIEPLGPAAGYSWNIINPGYCTVKWRGGGDGGRVVYVPQNFLSNLGNEPARVMSYILPAIERNFPDLSKKYRELEDKVGRLNREIGGEFTDWLQSYEQLENFSRTLETLGNIEDLNNEIATLDSKIETLREQTNITEADAKVYRNVTDDLKALEVKQQTAKAELEWIATLSDFNNGGNQLFRDDLIDIRLFHSANLGSLPTSLQTSIRKLEDEINQDAKIKVKAFIENARSAAENRVQDTDRKHQMISTDHRELFERFENNSSISELEAERTNQAKLLEKRKELEKSIHDKRVEVEDRVSKIANLIVLREEAQDQFVHSFRQNPVGYDDLSFGVELQFEDAEAEVIAEQFHARPAYKFVKRIDDGKSIFQLQKAQSEVATLLEDLHNESVKVKKTVDKNVLFAKILTTSRRIMFSASLDGDTIGGFVKSTMTPGKQALFALTLILSDAGESWPLLIDQPEDDLDSRSIYDEIVAFLKKQKRRRQILMVTHNANLVVGADAENVIVANRHGEDRKNRKERTFDYLWGALESSKTPKSSKYELQKQGVREHVVEILDGGREAFKKRQEKYKI